MLRTPELAMCRKPQVTTKCYRKIQKWNDREQAKQYFLEAMMNSEGNERERYTSIYIQLENGLPYCVDEEDGDEQA